MVEDKARTVTVEAVPAEFTLADLERIIALSRSQDTSSDKAIAPAKYTPEAVLALASRMGLDPNRVCTIMQDYAEGKYGREEQKISPEEFRLFMEEMRGYMKKKPRKNGGEGASDEKLEQFLGEMRDTQKKYSRSQSGGTSFTSFLGGTVIVATIFSVVGLGLSYMATNTKKIEISTLLDKTASLFTHAGERIDLEQQALKSAAELYGDVFFPGRSSDIKEATAINDYYSTLHQKGCSISEGVKLLKYLDDSTAYGLGTAELCKEATRYVTALNERDISLEKGIELLDTSIEKNSGTYANPPAWAVIDKAIAQLPLLPASEEETKKKLLNDLSDTPNPYHNPTDQRIDSSSPATAPDEKVPNSSPSGSYGGGAREL